MRNGIGIGMLVLSLAAVNVGAWAEDEEKVALDKVPLSVMKAVKDKFADAKIEGASKEEEDGKTIYEIELIHDGHEIDVSVSAAGKILEIEKEIKTADLPKAVSDAVKAKYPKGTIKQAEEVTAGEKKSYEVVVRLADEKNVEVKLDSAGKILEDEAEDDD
jgi:uncharacterized membrane protein YkoI